MVTGSSSDPNYQGNNFARKGVIFVSFNTRESIFAYPNSAELAGKKESQNFGILDVDKALEWVRNNIAGECASITLCMPYANMRQPLVATRTMSSLVVILPAPSRLITTSGTIPTPGSLAQSRWLPMLSLVLLSPL